MTTDTLEQRIRRLEDLEAIRLLKTRYAAACDNGYEPDVLAAMFTEDAIWDGGFIGRSEGREAIREFFRGSSRRLSFARHHVLNPMIEIDGDTAIGTWYLLQACTYVDGQEAVWGSGTYHDRYCRHGGEWKFTHVRIDVHFWTPYADGWAKTPFRHLR